MDEDKVARDREVSAADLTYGASYSLKVRTLSTVGPQGPADTVCSDDGCSLPAMRPAPVTCSFRAA